MSTEKKTEARKDSPKRIAKKSTPTRVSIDKEQRNMLCDRLNFAAAEAYKLLRTNLAFSLPAGKDCHIVGITSSTRGEGKSTTSVNLSYTIAETGKKVLLIDADMRLPSVAKKMGIPNKPGLSNALAGMCSTEEAIQHSDLLDNWHILPSGNIPPNPSELLGSEQMKLLLEKLSKSYQYIIVDLPPVTIVSDALVLSNYADGLICVVRQDYTSRGALNECMRQMQFLDAKLLGFVMSDTDDGSKGYGRYKRYGTKYYGSYGANSKVGDGRSYEDVWAFQHGEDRPNTGNSGERSK